MLSTGVRAETLAEAIAFAYQSNPTLQSQRAQLRAVDETYVQARSQYGPTVQVEASGRYTQDQLRNQFSRNTPLPDATLNENIGNTQVTVSQPLYTGGRATLDRRTAEFRIRRAREALRITEGDIVFSVIQTYLDVRRDQQALSGRRVNLAAIEAQVREVEARWKAGDVTRTDVAQSRAQLASEQANISTAENQLRTSQIAYASVVGRNPGNLEPEPALPNVPASVEQAWQIAGQTSPEFQQARFAEVQSRTQLASSKAATRPTVSLRGSFGYSDRLIPFGGRNFDRATVGQITLTLPIFSGGLTSSIIRQNAEQNSSDRLQIEVARRAMVQSTANAWNQMLTFRFNALRQKEQVDAATLAFKGMRIEYRAGQRSTTDVLIAEQILRDAELAKLNAEHDAYLSSALVLRFIGRLDAGDIVEALPRYDPSEHFRKVRNRNATPWEPLIRLIDSFALPRARQRAIPAPEAAIEPIVSFAVTDTIGPDQTTNVVPIAPVPGTVSERAAPILSNPEK